MKIINLKGGLGNQMFQYAYGRNIELKGSKIIFNTSFFDGNKAEGDTARDFKLNNFNIKTNAKFSSKNHPLNNLIKRILAKFGIKEDGYWQNEKYFKEIEANIRTEFTLAKPLSTKSLDWKDKILNIQNSVSLHIRRGDYIQNTETNKFHGTCDVDYYKKSIKKTVSMINSADIEIFVFSDDINWAKQNLSFPYQTHFISNLEIPDYEEIYLMSLCKYNIIANSTFSWWGAWLNNNPEKIVIGPKQWFTDKTTDELEILPHTWIQI